MCRLVCDCLIKTIKQPLIIGVILGLIGNGIFQGTNTVMPFWAANFFKQCGSIINPFGLIMLGMFVVKNLQKSPTSQLVVKDSYVSLAV